MNVIDSELVVVESTADWDTNAVVLKVNASFNFYYEYYYNCVCGLITVNSIVGSSAVLMLYHITLYAEKSF